MDGAVQRGGLHARTVLCPVNDRLVSLAVSSVEEQISGETVAGSPWVRVQVWGCPSGFLGPWPEVRRRARLAFASELVGVSRRIIDRAAVHIGSPRGPRREVLSEQTAPSGLTRASAKLADVRALIAACWADGSVEAAEWAVTAATAAQDAVAHHVAVICGEVNLALLHPMRFLVEQGADLQARNKRGQRPLEVAQGRKTREGDPYRPGNVALLQKLMGLPQTAPSAPSAAAPREVATRP